VLWDEGGAPPNVELLAVVGAMVEPSRVLPPKLEIPVVAGWADVDRLLVNKPPEVVGAVVLLLRFANSPADGADVVVVFPKEKDEPAEVVAAPPRRDDKGAEVVFKFPKRLPGWALAVSPDGAKILVRLFAGCSAAEEALRPEKDALAPPVDDAEPCPNRDIVTFGGGIEQ
jgi:hypothetical protein